MLRPFRSILPVILVLLAFASDARAQFVFVDVYGYNSLFESGGTITANFATDIYTNDWCGWGSSELCVSTYTAQVTGSLTRDYADVGWSFDSQVDGDAQVNLWDEPPPGEQEYRAGGDHLAYWEVRTNTGYYWYTDADGGNSLQSLTVGDDDDITSIAFEILSQTISTDGLFTEDTEIRAKAVWSDTGATRTDFVGTVELAENGTTIYSQNGGTLPESVNIQQGGTITFVAKSRAGPKTEGAGGAKPDPAIIRATNFPVYSSFLSVPQWFFPASNPDSKANGQVYEWVQRMVLALYSQYPSGDVRTVLNSVSTYSIDESLGAFGEANWGRASQSPIALNPLFLVTRLNGNHPGACGHNSDKKLFNTFLHEARHAYQAAQAALTGNDADFDYLSKNALPIGPAAIVQDTTAYREVCSATGHVSRAYKGDSNLDSSGAPDYALDAHQEDALVFAESHDQ
jgi:hypothetical protein